MVPTEGVTGHTCAPLLRLGAERKRHHGGGGRKLLITLTKAQVFKYKSIENSSLVDIGEDVTVLVGKNKYGGNSV